jgi:hypothetical protein
LFVFFDVFDADIVVSKAIAIIPKKIKGINITVLEVDAKSIPFYY